MYKKSLKNRYYYNFYNIEIRFIKSRFLSLLVNIIKIIVSYVYLKKSPPHIHFCMAFKVAQKNFCKNM